MEYKLPDVAALDDVDFEQQHEELRNRLFSLSKTVGNADPQSMDEFTSAVSCINNLFANLSARVQVLEQVAIKEGKYPSK